MTSRWVHVLRPGLHTTVQDAGRWGFQALGVPVAGPMDPFSHRLANALVGNARSAATLEITMTGPELEFEGDALVATAGADFEITVDGVPVARSKPVAVRAGTRLRFGSRKRGARAYMAVDGGFAVPLVLGSRATHAQSGIGGWHGRPLQKGDRLPVGERTTGRLRSNAHPHVDLRASGAPPAIVRVLKGPDADRFLDEAFEALQSAPYSIDLDSDRMGFRLRGPHLRHSRGADIISDVTPTGTIQVPGGEQPILLMVDRQTTGGYARIGTVISADLGVAGQCAPGDEISFRVCDVAEALSALIAKENALLAIEAATS